LNSHFVVHAVRGQRDRYQPVQSRLCSGSDPMRIVQAFLDLYPFNTLYIADLDAIRGSGNNNTDCINALIKRFAGLAFWIDNGSWGEISYRNPATMVIGSETGISPEQMQKLLASLPAAVLSLDFMDGKFLGDAALLRQPEIWPQHIIIMNLSRVGTATGPDIELFNKTKSIATDKYILNAGGIRSTDDLYALNAAGCAGVLVATALHDGYITGGDICAYYRNNMR
jgi:phosphoribosylformimino-5-aminoimidazole carboxamide ribotide isomerase